LLVVPMFRPVRVSLRTNTLRFAEELNAASAAVRRNKYCPGALNCTVVSAALLSPNVTGPAR
jgi:hypothetical protein